MKSLIMSFPNSYQLFSLCKCFVDIFRRSTATEWETCSNSSQSVCSYLYPYVAVDKWSSPPHSYFIRPPSLPLSFQPFSLSLSTLLPPSPVVFSPSPVYRPLSRTLPPLFTWLLSFHFFFSPHSV